MSIKHVALEHLREKPINALNLLLSPITEDGQIDSPQLCDHVIIYMMFNCHRSAGFIGLNGFILSMPLLAHTYHSYKTFCVALP